MRMIIEKKNGTVFCYFEDESHYRVVKPSREEISFWRAMKILDDECNMSAFPDNTCFSVRIKKKQSCYGEGHARATDDASS